MKDNDKYFERLEQLDWTEAQTKRLSSFAFPGRDFALIGSTEQEVPTQGLTKREYFAGLAMQGLVAKEGWSERIMEEGGDKSLCIYIAAASVKMADELLKQLEQ